MSLMRLLEQAQGGQGLAQLASQFGLDEAKAGELSKMLAPAIGQATKRRAQEGQLEQVLGAFQGEAQGGLFDDAAAAAAPEGRAQGEQFLDQLFGGAEGRQGLATEAASRAGVDVEQVQNFMPAMAAMLQGGMQRNLPDNAISGLLSSATSGGGGGGGLMGMIGSLLGGSKGGSGGPDLSMLTNLLDADGDGDVMDDLVSKFMR